MSFVTWKIEVSPYNGSTWSSATQVTSFYGPDVQVSTGDSRDMFSFKMNNFANSRLLTAGVNDKVTIYRAVNTSTITSDHIIMVGTVSNISPEEDDRKDLIRVEGYNYTDTIMSAIGFADATNLTIPNAISSLLSSVSLYASQFGVTWNSSNPSTRVDGTAFPVVGEKYFNRPLRQIIEKLSTKEVTGDSVVYYWYVNKDNELIWRPATLTASYTFNASTDDYKAAKPGKDVSEVKNYVIIKGGVDPNGVVIQTKYYDSASVVKNRPKYLIITDETKFALNLHKADCDKAGVRTMKDYTFGTFVPTWTSTSYSSFNTYVDAFRTYVKAYLSSKGRQAVETTLKGRLMLTVEFAPGKGWPLGALIAVTHPFFGSTVKQLRVTDIHYTTERDIFTLKEDIGSL